MGIKTAKSANYAGQLGQTGYGLHSMYDADGYGGASIALSFGSQYGSGLRVGFHASTDDVREFARQLFEYADAADKAQSEAKEVAA